MIARQARAYEAWLVREYDDYGVAYGYNSGRRLFRAQWSPDFTDARSRPQARTDATQIHKRGWREALLDAPIWPASIPLPYIDTGLKSGDHERCSSKRGPPPRSTD